MTGVPGHAANNPHAVVPWSALEESPDRFLEPGCIPADIQLKEISKMKAATLNACISHWMTRVEKGKIAFRFKAVEDAHRREQKPRKKRRQPLSDDEEEDEVMSMMGKSHQDSAEDKNNGEEDDRVMEEAGKGKARAIPIMWYDYIIAQSSRDTTYFDLQPIRCAQSGPGPS